MAANGGTTSPLTFLGLQPDDEVTYRLLLSRPGATVQEVAELLGLSGADTGRTLARLGSAGMLAVADGRVEPVSPDEALGRLVTDEARRLQGAAAQLEAVRAMLPSLMADHLAAQSRVQKPVDIQATEGGDVVALIRSLSDASTGDLLWLRPDQWRLPVTAEIDDWVRQLVAGGRTSRAIYPARALELAPEVVRARAESGEHVRILASVPCRLSIMGTTAALIPDRWGERTSRRLVVREHSVIGAFTALFELLWERAVPVPGLDDDADGRGRPGRRRLLLHQLAGGAKDEQIARVLGLSLRTVRRRVSDLMDELGVESRFQAGVEAVRRGWL